VKSNVRNGVIESSSKKSKKNNAKERRKAARAQLFANQQNGSSPSNKRHQGAWSLLSSCVGPNFKFFILKKKGIPKKRLSKVAAANSTSLGGGFVVGGNAAPISSENIGNRLLRGMGWSGGGLGVKKQGVEDPIQATVKNNRFGIGF